MRAPLDLSALLSLGIVAVAPVWSTPLLAQGIPVLEPGALVRVEVPEVQRRAMHGTITDMDAERLVLLLAGDTAQPVTIPLASLTRLDVGTTRSRGSAATRGAGIGGMIGAGIGLGVALVLIAVDPAMEYPAPAGYFDINPEIWSGPSRGETLAILTLGGAVVGAAVGGLKGLAAPGHTWHNRWHAGAMSLRPVGNGRIEVRYSR